MRKLFLLPILFLGSCTSAQQGNTLPEAALLLTTHYSGTSAGKPPTVTWTPKAEEIRQQFDYPATPQQFGKVSTMLDTVLYPSTDLALVFFRTTRVNEDPELPSPGSWCTLCEDWLGLARYAKGAGGEWELLDFNKWFHKQGVFDQVSKPVLVETGRGRQAARIISSDGELEYHRTTHHIVGLPELKNVLSIATNIYEVEREGFDVVGGAEPVEHTYSFIPTEKDWYDVEVNDGSAKPVRWVYSSTTGKYAPAVKAPVK